MGASVANNVIGLFENEGIAERVVDDLVSSGFDRSSITRFRGDHDDLEGELEREGVPTNEASYYVNGLSEGGALVSVRAEEADTNRAVEIMNRYANTDDEARGDESAYDAAAEPATGLAADRYETAGVASAERGVSENRTTASTTDDETRLEVVEESLRVGKREVERGGVRVRRVVTETPVTEQVTLRDETVHVDRRAVDRPLTGNADDLFTEQTFEFTEIDEEAVVAKEARVVEEVVIDKDVVEHTQTVQDTVRRTDVEIEEISADASAGRASYGTTDADHVYGRALASDARYAGRDWDDLEVDARRDWEAQNQGGVWNDVRGRVRDAWERSRR